jgi:hypothetical protein
MFTGEQFPTNEATTLFFGISKLFQNKDPSLRQMVYLILKELANTAEDVIMSTSIIMKDTAVGSDVLYRANAIRALCRIIDASTVQGIERLIKTAIVDKTPSVSSAALVSSYHLLPIARDVVRRWQSETQEAASSSKQSSGFLGFASSSQTHAISQSNFMTQYHAIGLLYQMRSHDRMALVKMVQQYGAEEPSGFGAVGSSGGQVGGGRPWSPQTHDADAGWLAPSQARNGQLRGRKGYLRYAGGHRCRGPASRSCPTAVPVLPTIHHQVRRNSHSPQLR